MSAEKSLNFIEEIIEKDLMEKQYEQIITRFPPEPNGYLHLGHASSICLNFGLTKSFPGYTNLRFDDTNPETEDTEYVDSIKLDIQWLGFQWKNEYYASDYFEQLYQFAHTLIDKDLAYVDDSSSEEIRALKGTPTESGKNGVFRDRSKDENKDLFNRMRAGEFADGAKVLRAKIDMAHTNMLMRDPVLYRIKHTHHHRTGDAWCIYPMYDFAHGQSDSIEHITHSICTMEFIPHRELYDWLIHNLDIYPSHQYEFARRNINYTITSKRKLLQLVTQGAVDGWDDPRMPTISGLRRRGYTSASIRDFCHRAGIAKRDNMVDVSLLENSVREDLNKTALRRMAVLDPIKLIITNYEEGKTEMLPAENNPEDDQAGHREIPFGRELWIERDDFIENPPPKFFRLGPGLTVRLKHAYIIQCEDYNKNEAGEITEVYAKYFPDSKSGSDNSGIKVKGTMHWLSAPQAKPAEIRLYDRLFKVENPSNEDGDFMSYVNESSLHILSNSFVEPSLLSAAMNDRFQFIRLGYFCLDKNSSFNKIIFNRTVSLKDSWSKIKEG